MPQIVGIIGRRHPQPQNIGARFGDHVLRRDDVAVGLRHLVALLVEHEAVRQHDVVGRMAARAAALEQRRMEPAAMLVRTFEVHDLILAAVDVARQTLEARKAPSGLRA